MTLEGSNFVSDSKAFFNGTAKVTAYVSATELTAQIEAADIDEALAMHESWNTAEDYSFKVFVRNPFPGGGDSDSLDFLIKKTITKGDIVLTIDSSKIGEKNITR